MFKHVIFACLRCRYHRAGDNWLNINPVQVEDYGEYLCTARNELGVGEGVIVLERAGFTVNCFTIACRKFVFLWSLNKYIYSSEFQLIQK